MELETITREGEIWKEYPLNSWYLISNQGRVWSNRSRLRAKYKPFGLLTLAQEPAGYIATSLLFTDGEYIMRRIRVHRLVAQTFKENPDNLSDVNHIDGDKTNNNDLNLEWVTHSDNIIKSYETGQRVAISGVDHWLTGKKVKLETRLKQSEAKKGTRHPKFKGHYIINGQVFESANQAAIALNTSAMQVIRNTKSNNKGYQFIPLVT